ncbi:MAG: wax ester/triacylglycerol synthase family O-acyltransferase [Solirubrobacteraceae bacterium]
MTQQHLDRLSAVDASFLAQEGPSSHMHVGGLLIFDGAPPEFDDVLDSVRGRLHMVPRYRQKLATPPLETGRPLWVDDPTFNIEFHVRHTALPSPGTEDQLLALAARIASQPLDRTKPLWELWLVEGLRGAGDSSAGDSSGGDSSGGESGGERFALISKTHHSLVDGVSGVDLATVLFDFDPDPKPPPRAPSTALEPWRPKQQPTSTELAVAGVRDAMLTVTGVATKALTGLLTPNRSVDRLRDAVEGIGEIVWAELNPAPSTPLNVPIGPYRRFSIVRGKLADYKLVKGAFGGTVNDVVLSVVSGALARWLHARGVRTEGLELRALVPVSVRTSDQHHALGNQLTVMRGPLPVYVQDPVARIEVVRAAMDDLKGSKQAIGASTLTAAQMLAPPTVLAQASRLNFSTRLFNLLVTNIPGPQRPLYMLGRQLQDLFPIAFLPQNHALAIALMSYNGGVHYGVLGDFDALDDIELIASGIKDELELLVKAAHAVTQSGTVEKVPPTAAEDAPPTAPEDAPPTAPEDAPPAATNGSGADSSNGTHRRSILPTTPRRSSAGPASDMRAKRAHQAQPPRGRSPR